MRSGAVPVRLAGFVLAVAVAATGCSLELDGGGGGSGDSGGGPDGGAPGAPGSAVAAVDELAVKGRAPRTGYDRDRFGSPWVDTDSNGCGTRDDILRRDLTEVRSGGGDRCRVMSGTLAEDPYSGRDVAFRRGASRVDIDHVVALSDAWQKGAAKWDRGKRVAFANDPLNLLAVGSRPNRAKGDGDTATWLPPNKAYRCAYVARQVAVKRKYRLWVTVPERSAMRRVLDGCPSEPLPKGGNPTKAPQRYAR
ncbi:HNH endonuclease family protein [Streptomyces uncialis]|uniref:HNH endonuclease family protein n=1 Tax=Streptomyces uncialis TaxID=1048205 RepID=UPI003653ABF3